MTTALAERPPFRSFAAWMDYLKLDSSVTTWLYWGGVGLVVSGLFATKLLPCVDYSQHLALSDIARRLQDPSAPEHAEFQLNLFTYNGLFHLVVAVLSRWIPIEIAGRLVISGSLVAMAAAVVALVRLLRRPLFHAALFTPVLFSFSLGWGFVNYVLATAIAAWTLVLMASAALRPRAAILTLIAVFGFACAYAHVLAMLILCLVGATLTLELGWRTAPRTLPTWSRAIRGAGRGVLATLPLLIGCIYCIEVYRRQFVWDPNMYRDPTLEGSAPPLWQKVVFFSAFASDLFGDATDQVILWLTLGVMGWSAFKAWTTRERRPREDPPPVVMPFAVTALAYFATPMVLIGTHLIFPRLGQWAVLGALLATPRFPDQLVNRARTYVLRLAVLAGANVLLHCALYNWETRDASAVIDDLPNGRAVTAVIWDAGTIAFRNGTLTHLAAYYAARKHGRWAFAFARYLSVPVRFKPNKQPPWPERGWEFSAEDYDPRCAYARAFPLVIVRAPEETPRDASSEPLVRQLVFKRDAARVKLLSHHGRFWAFDVGSLPSG